MDKVSSIGEIFRDIEYRPLRGGSEHALMHKLEFSSREVVEGALFFCVPGLNVDGHDFARDAVLHGASGLVVDHELDLDCPQYLVSDVRRALALCSANFYGRPSEKLKLVGITGTNGKTTTAFLVEHLVKSCDQTAGLMGTVECHVADTKRPSLHTTPESRDLQELLAEMVDAGVDVAALEVSSHAIDLDRIVGTRFAVASFSNLTQDHLDYHKTMENYFNAKARLFTDFEVGARVVCTDNEYGLRLVHRIRNAGHKVLELGFRKDASLRLLRVKNLLHATEITLGMAPGELMPAACCNTTISFALPLVGRFNVENALVSFGIGLVLGYTPERIASALEKAPQVPGRMERVIGSDGSVPNFDVLVDYAHTPDSLSKAIAAIRDSTQGRIICVFGCGGDRDQGKRPKMGAAALAADLAIVTSDNPRTEDPSAIIDMILPGMKDGQDRTRVIIDRREAIASALSQAHEGDCVLIAGKGHENYQIVGNSKRHFDDREIAGKELAKLS